jgi:opacity protein-like surface antigen
MNGEMNRRLRRRRIVALLLSFAAASVSIATAQPPTQVRVVKDDATIWTSITGAMLASVPGGTDLQVVSQQNGWYEVVVPAVKGRARATGVVAASDVEPIVPGKPAPIVKRSPRPKPMAGSSWAAGPLPWLRGFGQAGYGRFAASQTFDAVLGSAGGAWFGGGARVQVKRHYFAEIALEHYGGDGERVFVNKGQVFRLGIPDHVSITPVMATAGYTYAWRPAFRPYAGLGIGHYALSETSVVGSDSSEIHQATTGYHASVGLEWRTTRSISTAFEFQYRIVSNALDGGTAALFGEDDLGGPQFKVKVLFGR